MKNGGQLERMLDVNANWKLKVQTGIFIFALTNELYKYSVLKSINRRCEIIA